MSPDYAVDRITFVAGPSEFRRETDSQGRTALVERLTSPRPELADLLRVLAHEIALPWRRRRLAHVAPLLEVRLEATYVELVHGVNPCDFVGFDRSPSRLRELLIHTLTGLEAVHAAGLTMGGSALVVVDDSGRAQWIAARQLSQWVETDGQPENSYIDFRHDLQAVSELFREAAGPEGLRRDLADVLERANGTAAEWLDQLVPDRATRVPETSTQLDARLVAIRSLRPPPNTCPACGEILGSVQPAPSHTCLVCCSAKVEEFAPDFASCPICHIGFWRQQGDAETCDTCGARRGQELDGRVRVVPGSQDSAPPESRFPEEWARIAARRPALGGNGECPACRATYILEAHRATLLHAEHHLREAERFGFRPLAPTVAAWFAAGGVDGSTNLVCEGCGLALYAEDLENVTLQWSPIGPLRGRYGETRSYVAWHRLAQDLDPEEDAGRLEARLRERLADDYRRGRRGFDGQAGQVWRGPARNMRSNMRGTLLLDSECLRWRCGVVRRNWPREDLEGLRLEGDRLTAALDNGQELGFVLAPAELEVCLSSGRYCIGLTAADLAARLGSRSAMPERKRG